MLKYVLNKGMDINYIDLNYWNALTYAITNDKYIIMRYLLKKHIEVNLLSIDYKDNNFQKNVSIFQEF